MPVVSIDVLTLFIGLVIAVVGWLLVPILYFGITRRMMGQLGKAEFRNKNGHVLIIEAPDGSTVIERAKLHYTGILTSLAKVPRFGRFFFSGKDTILRPVNAPRISFVEARDAVSANTSLIALAETLKGEYQPIKQYPGVPRADNIESLIIWTAENKYFPTLTYQPRVRVLTPGEREKLAQENPVAYQQWRQEYIADQLASIHFEIQRVNDISLMNEIKLGTIRRITTFEGYTIDEDKLIVKPNIISKVATKPLKDNERRDWFIKMVNIFANLPEVWPIEIGGRTVDVRDIFRWNVSTFSQGDVSQLDAVTREIIEAQRRTDTVRLFVLGIVFVMVMVGVVIVLKGIGVA